MSKDTPLTATPPPLGDLATRMLACWLATLGLTGRYTPGLQDVVIQRDATIHHLRAEVIRREVAGVGVR